MNGIILVSHTRIFYVHVYYYFVIYEYQTHRAQENYEGNKVLKMFLSLSHSISHIYTQ